MTDTFDLSSKPADGEANNFYERSHDLSSPTSRVDRDPTSESHSLARSDSPEALLLRENRAIRCVKIFVCLVLLAAAVSIAGFIFGFTSSSEKENFRNDFALISDSIAENLILDSSQVFTSAQSIATAMTILLEAYNTSAASFYVPLPRYRSLTKEIVKFSQFASWNPFLRSDQERREFENMVRQKEKDGFFAEGLNPPCFVCGDENMAPSTPEVMVLFPGNGQYSCDQLDTAGHNGVLEKTYCTTVTSFVKEKCSCLPANTTKSEREARSPSEGIFTLGGKANLTMIDQPWDGGPYMPMFLDSLAIADHQPVLYNHLSYAKFVRPISQMIVSGRPQVTEMMDQDDTSIYRLYSGPLKDATAGPVSIIFFPVESPLGNSVAGSLSLQLHWGNLLQRPVPRNGKLVTIVIESSCGQTHTYNVKEDGRKLQWVGSGDFHDRRYGNMVRQTSFDDFRFLRVATADKDLNGTSEESCDYKFAIYPTAALEDQYITSNPWIYAASAILILLFTATVFIGYDYMVRRRQAKIMALAKQTDTIVASLFPSNVRDRLYNHGRATDDSTPNSMLTRSANYFLSNASGSQASVFGSAPIADLFPSCTVMFIDIANFTAWCSEREPSQVFILLENIYHEFDKIADQLGVFKVETIGDSYVAVAGLPTPREDHAVVMARFACICLSKMEQRVKELEVSLGPSTGDLRARCGLHSGPVTAGVLRGAKARFQLFGDTVNTASRMESSSAPSRIHGSEQTVSLLRQANKSTWAISREEKVHLKGKGTVQTFWLDPRREKTQSVASRNTSIRSSRLLPEISDGSLANSNSDRQQRKQRLIEWNVEVLCDLLGRVVSARNAAARSTESSVALPSKPSWHNEGTIVLDEMTEIIEIPRFDPKLQLNLQPVKLSSNVKEQLHSYVSGIANLYRDEVPFHNFEHASHVIMSATKLMKRIMSPEGIDWDLRGIRDDNERRIAIARQVHEVTYGLSSDHLMQFSVVFSALVHDVDHTGMTNKELIDVDDPAAHTYRNKCVAEQNSVDVAWNLLMDDKYSDLRACIFSSDFEQKRFRELIVDAVLATDIADGELGLLRKSRWEQAFQAKASTDVEAIDLDRKATIVFEHIIQASDVCHCMQHWHTYQKFNSRLFEERYVAHRRGVVSDPPWVGWYKGEIWFFDNYIIPLAQKLHECGVFGVSYHEYLNYAQENRLEWERKGHEIVESLRIQVENKYQNAVFPNKHM
jgi:class 3 adenylate cyclase